MLLLQTMYINCEIYIPNLSQVPEGVNNKDGNLKTNYTLKIIEFIKNVNYQSQPISGARQSEAGFFYIL